MIEYERLLQIARKMHLWLFLNTDDELKVYDELGLTDEENIILGYSGKVYLDENNLSAKQDGVRLSLMAKDYLDKYNLTQDELLESLKNSLEILNKNN